VSCAICGVETGATEHRCAPTAENIDALHTAFDLARRKMQGALLLAASQRHAVACLLAAVGPVCVTTQHKSIATAKGDEYTIETVNGPDGSPAHWVFALKSLIINPHGRSP